MFSGDHVIPYWRPAFPLWGCTSLPKSPLTSQPATMFFPAARDRQDMKPFIVKTEVFSWVSFFFLSLRKEKRKEPSFKAQNSYKSCVLMANSISHSVYVFGALQFWMTQMTKKKSRPGGGAPPGWLLLFKLWGINDTKCQKKLETHFNLNYRFAFFPFLCLLSPPTHPHIQLSFSIANSWAQDLNESRSCFLCLRSADNCITIWATLQTCYQLWNK